MAKACCALIAERRWVLTGTPIVRSLSIPTSRILKPLSSLQDQLAEGMLLDMMDALISTDLDQ